MRPGDRLVCVFVARYQIGAQFAAWPLHITIVPWFRLSTVSNQIAADLHEVLHSLASFQVIMAGEAVFGKGKLVNLVQLPTPLQIVEQTARRYLHHQRAWLVDESTKARFSYRPHVTAQGIERMHEGEVFDCSKLSIVRQKCRHKQIVAEVTLGS
jgi:2'-5' RNA ligase